MRPSCIFLAISTILVINPIDPINSANILFYFAVSGASHRIGIWPIVELLAKSGHNITYLSPLPAKPGVSQPHPNITNITPPNLAKDTFTDDYLMPARLQDGVHSMDARWFTYDQLATRSCKSLLRNTEYTSWLERAGPFDLIVMNSLYNECGYGIAHIHNSKVIMMTPSTFFPWWQEAYGLPEENLPEMQYHYSLKDRTMLQSVLNHLLPIYHQWHRSRYTLPELRELWSSRLSREDLPSFNSIEEDRTTVVFSNTHPSHDYPRLLPPNFVGIGGVHCSDNRKPVPKDVATFIKSENGDDADFILFSFGSFFEISKLPTHLQETIFASFKKFPDIKFIVKYDSETPPSFPANAKAVKWFPQQDVIAHPKILAFMSHGGLLGTQEAIYHGVPIIAFPFFADQDYNAMNIHQRETGIMLEISQLTTEKLTQAISQILTDKRYKENAVKQKTLFRDRLVKRPEDEAVWWIEYVLRHDDFSHLKHNGAKKPWWERKMLHIWSFILLVSVTCIGFVVGFLFVIYKAIMKLVYNLLTKPKVD